MDDLIRHSRAIEKSQKKLEDELSSSLDDLSVLLEQTKNEITQDPTRLQSSLAHLQETTTKQFEKLPDEKVCKDHDKPFFRVQREYNSAVNKLKSDIEKRFKQDLSVISNPEAFSGKSHLLHRAMALHFIREGQFELCDTFMKESGIDDEDELYVKTELLKGEFRKMYSIMQELEERDLANAITWARENHEALRKMGSSLEFNIHRLRYIQLLAEQKPMEALMYGRELFAPFADKHLTEIKRLMTSMIYYRDIAESPYADMYSPTLWADIRIEFQRDFCALLNMSADSPLYASVLVGTTALPVIMKLYKIMSAKKTEWSQQDELPVEIPLSEDLRFHSVFACPVSKEQATEDNPPMMMPCGHVICRESLTRLSRSSRYGRNAMRFKCPYCPSESAADQAIQVYF
ncbi:CTLH/CRA C-terminal to lish motif domain-domain-containing protein [Syncephalastrum racemosum]|uniref:GID complex catalytic subunit 2 n=1 Tax=Syncephalastrum racemosum TaxID=13706 RepID=A0A1X2HAV4_SYNRA|nr:CTLH/CRA C-terminal to lish motif domain-domain-containing protein [Syncephalastrum racemosum]